MSIEMQECKSPKNNLKVLLTVDSIRCFTPSLNRNAAAINTETFYRD